MSVYTHCVVIELERVDEARIQKYLYEHVYSYNWILKEVEETSKIRVCVWWREEDYRNFCTTPLRSFLKRLKNKSPHDTIKISKTMSTEEGVQTVCKGVRGSISKYYLEAPLYPYLRELLSVDILGELSSARTTPNTMCNHILKIVDTLDISAKLELLQKITAAVVPQVKQRLSEVNENVPSPPEGVENVPERLSEVNENVPSPLSTHAGDSTRSSLLDEPKMEEMEQLFPFEDPILPIVPSAPLMF